MEAALEIRQQAVEQARIMKELSHWENSQSKLTPNTNSDVKPINSEKIKSFEYDKWEAFNVEEALANLNSEQLISSTPTRNHPVLSAEDSLFEKEKGNAYFAKGKFKKAVQCYTKSIGLNPKFAASYLNRALAFIKLKMFSEAAEDASLAIQLEPKNIKAFWRRAIAYREMGLYPESKKDFEAALVFEPTNISVLNDLKVLKLLIEKKITKELKSQPLITVSKSASSLIRKRVEIQEINRDKVLSGLSPAAEQIDEKANVCKPRNIEENEAEGAVATLHTASVNNGVMENDNAVLKLFNNIAGSTAKNPSEPKNGTHISRYPGPIDSLYKFQIAWKSSDNNLNGRRQILESVKGANLGFIFKDSLEISYLSEILEVLQEYFLDARIECGAKIFESIAKLPRFKMVSMLLPKKDKEILELLKNKYAR